MKEKEFMREDLNNFHILEEIKALNISHTPSKPSLDDI
jgi:hypothetical protein